MEHFADAELDRLLSQLSEGDFDLERVDPTFSGLFNAPAHVECARVLEAEPSTSCSNGPPASSGSRFAIKSDGQVQETKTNSIPKNTERNTNWAVKIWKEWSVHRQKSFPGKYSEWPIHLLLANNHDLDYWLSKFVVEARRSDGECYPPNTLYSICCGLM